METEKKPTPEATKETTPEVTVTEIVVTEINPVSAPVEITNAPYVRIPVKTFKRYAYAFALGLLLVVFAFLFSKGVFVAATVNGSPISRLAVISKLEEQGGKDALQAIINEKLIKAEIAKSNVVVEQSAIDAKITEIEAQVKGQGGTLEEALTAENMTMDQLKDQIMTQQKLEKILADKLAVTDEEVAAFVEENKITPPKEMTIEEFTTSVKEQLQQQKFQEESQKWVASVTEAAKIKYYVTY